MGLFPRSGAIAPGSDADITILEPTPRTIRKEDLHESDYSPWEGYEATAWPILTVLHGKIVVEGGQFHGAETDGTRINRKIAGSILKGPSC
jgi:dihydropyrimidinase